MFKDIRIEDEKLREWFGMVLRSLTRDAQADAREHREHLQLTKVIEQQDRLLNLRLGDEIDGDVFAKKQRELRDLEADLKLKMEIADRSHHETADLAAKVFELSQSLTEIGLRLITPRNANPRNRLFERCARRRKSLRGNESALRRTRQRAYF